MQYSQILSTSARKTTNDLFNRQHKDFQETNHFLHIQLPKQHALSLIYRQPSIGTTDLGIVVHQTFEAHSD